MSSGFPAPPRHEVRPATWSADEYLRLADTEVFAGRRFELLDGVICERSPQHWEHASALDRIAEILRAAWGEGVWIRTRLPLRLDEPSLPEPGVSVVAGTRGDYRDHPATALLVVEVSRPTLDHDLRKRSIYARAEIPIYWIVDLPGRVVHVHESPGLVEDDAKGRPIYDYLAVATPSPDAFVDLPTGRSAVSELLGED